LDPGSSQAGGYIEPGSSVQNSDISCPENGFRCHHRSYKNIKYLYSTVRKIELVYDDGIEHETYGVFVNVLSGIH
jgi:hypothetical protein